MEKVRLTSTLAELNVNTRVYNILAYKLGCKSVFDVCLLTEEFLLYNVRGFGEHSLTNLIAALEEDGFHLAKHPNENPSRLIQTHHCEKLVMDRRPLGQRVAACRILKMERVDGLTMWEYHADFAAVKDAIWFVIQFCPHCGRELDTSPTVPAIALELLDE